MRILLNRFIKFRYSSIFNEPASDLSINGSFIKDVRSHIERLQSETINIPLFYNGMNAENSESYKYQHSPLKHSQTLCSFQYATKSQIQESIECLIRNQFYWRSIPFEQRKIIFVKAAELISTKYRANLIASIMYGQGKNYYQADIDLCELVDFLRFNVYYAEKLISCDLISPDGIKNYLEYRPLEGFVAAICPFNFTAISGNLAAAPAMLGNVVVWKPSDNAMHSSWLVYKILIESGLPKNVIQFLPSDGPIFGDVITSSAHLSAINFTGSEKTFKKLCNIVGNNIDQYRTFPRLLGECGGKNFHLVHSSCDLELAVYSTIRAAFEYAGQKCSACSRLYIPSTLWPSFFELLKQQWTEFQTTNFMDKKFFISPVINETSFNKVKSYIDYAKTDASHKIVLGGSSNKNDGYFIDPTVILTTDFDSKLLNEEIFGPILTVYLYDENDFDDLLMKIDSTSKYGLTAGIFSNDKNITDKCLDKLYNTAGNIYINDKCTGAVVGQQPFGGARNSGTNDKAGMDNYLLRFLSPRTIKINKNKLNSWMYDYMK